jgi:multiple sugar transport system substrate-binding protein
MLAISAGVPPDVAGLWGPNVPQYADEHAVMPLDELCEEFGIDTEAYIPSYWNIATYNGKIWALPSTPASTALHYNKRILREHGYTEPPKTIEEMDEMAARMTRKGGRGFELAGFMHSEPGWWNWAWAYFFGGKLADEENGITTNLQENLRAYNWIRTYSEKYGPGDLQTFKSGFGNFSSPQNAFMSEKVAMVLQGVWMYNFIDKFAPDVEWAAAPFPHPADRPDLANTTFVDMDILVIPRGAKHPREAFEFIAYVQQQKVMEKLCLSHQKNSPLRAVSDEFWDQHKNPYIRLFHDLAASPNAISPPRLGIWPEIGAEMNATFEAVTLLQKTPAEALSDAEARLKPRLEQYIQRRDSRLGTKK